MHKNRIIVPSKFSPYKVNVSLLATLIALSLPISSGLAADTIAPAKEVDDSSAAVAASTVKVEVSGVEGELLENVRGFLEIFQLDGKEAPSSSRVSYMHRAAEEQIAKALEAFGYFRPSVKADLSKIDGNYLAKYDIDIGKQIILNELQIEVLGPGKEDSEFQKAIEESPLKVGSPLNQIAYESLKRQFQVIASQRGYFDASLEDHEIRVDLAASKAEMNVSFETGKRYKLGDVSFRQPKEWISEELLDRFVEIESGQWYESADLQQLQGDLSNTDYYSAVELTASPDEAKDSVIPVVVDLKPRNARKYIFGVGYGTDTGARIKAGVVGRRVNTRGHNYGAAVLVAQTSYGIAGDYIIPTGDPRTDSYGIRTLIEDEHTETQNYKAFNLGGYYKKRDGYWIKTYALDYHVEEFELTDETPTSTLLIPSVDWTRTFPAELDKRIYPMHGTWLQLHLKAGIDALLSDTDFIQPLIAAKWIHGFDNKSRVIARGAIGTTWVDNFDALPTSLRFFAGGDRSVRGYSYGIISPLDDAGEEIGGKHLTEASLEYEYPIKDKWSVAAFMDIGDAYDDKPEMNTGFGLGVRWISPIGPVRIDFGSAVDRPPGRNFRVHLTIGPDL